MTKRDFQNQEYQQEQLCNDTVYSYTSGIVWVHRKVVDALIEEERRERDEEKAFWMGELRSRTAERDNERLVRIGTETDRDFARREKDAAIFHITELRTDRNKLQARVAELEALLESEMWGVNCKPSAPDWLTKEDRETLLRLSYSLDYVQYATSADFIRSLLARSTPKVKEPKDVN